MLLKSRTKQSFAYSLVTISNTEQGCVSVAHDKNQLGRVQERQTGGELSLDRHCAHCIGAADVLLCVAC